MAPPSITREVWNLPEIVEYFRSDNEIAENLTEQDFDNLFNYDLDWIKLVKTALEYQEFDPKVILSQMLRNRRSYEAQRKARLEWNLRNVGDDLKTTATTEGTDKFSNQESLTNDVNFLVTVFLSRNNHINEMKARGGVEDILNMLKEKYNIDDEVNKSVVSLESRTITLPRIAEVFPGVAARMFHDKAVKEIVTYESFPGSTKPDSHSICCPLLPSICPMTMAAKDANTLHPTMIWTAIKLDDMDNGFLFTYLAN